MIVSKRYLAEENKRLTIENTAYLQLLNDRANNLKPDATERVEGRKGEWLSGELWRAKSAHGGIVVVIQDLENGEADARIHYLDDLNSNLQGNHSEYTLHLRIVLEKLTRERNRIAGYKA